MTSFFKDNFEREAYMKGYTAFCQKVSRLSNPFNKKLEPDCFRLWNDGWDIAASDA